MHSRQRDARQAILTETPHAQYGGSSKVYKEVRIKIYFKTLLVKMQGHWEMLGMKQTVDGLERLLILQGIGKKAELKHAPFFYTSFTMTNYQELNDQWQSEQSYR